MTLNIGDSASSFSIPNQDLASISLESLVRENRVLLIFFPSCFEGDDSNGSSSILRYHPIHSVNPTHICQFHPSISIFYSELNNILPNVRGGDLKILGISQVYKD